MPQKRKSSLARSTRNASRLSTLRATARRAQETPERTDAGLAYQRIRTVAKRTNETSEQTRARMTHQRTRTTAKRTNEISVQTDAKLTYKISRAAEETSNVISKLTAARLALEKSKANESEIHPSRVFMSIPMLNFLHIRNINRMRNDEPKKVSKLKDRRRGYTSRQAPETPKNPTSELLLEQKSQEQKISLMVKESFVASEKWILNEMGFYNETCDEEYITPDVIENHTRVEELDTKPDIQSFERDKQTDANPKLSSTAVTELDVKVDVELLARHLKKTNI